MNQTEFDFHLLFCSIWEDLNSVPFTSFFYLDLFLQKECVCSEKQSKEKR